METLWFFIVAVMIAIYVVLDGFDLGAGIVQLYVARSEDERQSLRAAIGPFWDGNEVWLLAGGGALFLAFPRVYAVGFSGFYLPLMLVLWLLVLRGLSMELRAHLDNPLWRQLWDALLTLSSALLAVVLGAALGNVIRGVPIDSSGWFAMGLFSREPGELGVLDLYTVAVGLLALAMLAAHGALFLAWKCSGEMRTRARHAAWAAIALAAPLGIAVTFATAHINAGFFPAIAARTWGWAIVLPLLVAMMGSLLAHRSLAAFLLSCLSIAALLAFAAAAVFPVLLRSTIDPRFSIDAYNGAAATGGLRTALGWWLLGLPLACGYFVWLFRVFRGKVAEAGAPARARPHSLSQG